MCIEPVWVIDIKLESCSGTVGRSLGLQFNCIEFALLLLLRSSTNVPSDPAGILTHASRVAPTRELVRTVFRLASVT